MHSWLGWIQPSLVQHSETKNKQEIKQKLLCGLTYCGVFTLLQSNPIQYFSLRCKPDTTALTKPDVHSIFHQPKTAWNVDGILLRRVTKSQKPNHYEDFPKLLFSWAYSMKWNCIDSPKYHLHLSLPTAQCSAIFLFDQLLNSTVGEKSPDELPHVTTAWLKAALT